MRARPFSLKMAAIIVILLLLCTNFILLYKISSLMPAQKDVENMEEEESGVLSAGNKDKESKRIKTSFEFSTEGSTLIGIYSGDSQLQYLSVDSLGELGRQIEEFSFTEESIIYTQTVLFYKEPFYMEPHTIGYDKVELEQYIIEGQDMYAYHFGEAAKKVPDELREETSTRLDRYIKVLEE